MCSLAGIVKFSSAPAPWQTPRLDFSALTAMSAAIAHRGPDGDGLYVDPRANKTAALVHRRLAIIDLPGGHQPMANEDGTVHVVFNGEIYNHAELRRQLQAAGHRFTTDHSDTEVLVHGWEQWGTALPEKLLGMFALAIWDTRPDATGAPRDTLFLARDRLGQKPLFYATLEDGIVFGSTIPSLLAWPEVPRRIPRDQIALYLILGYVPPPQTIYRDISQVMPGGWIRLQRDLLDGGMYWNPATARPETPSDPASPGPALRREIARSVESQLIADVPIACFLSGGIDSSIIAATMQQAVLAQGGPPIHTVSVGFQESAFDETLFAAAVAKKIGSRHTRLEVRADQDPLETLQLLMRQSLGQPFADSSILPTYHLSKAVRAIAPVALSGDGADELFAGYDRYRALQLLCRWPNVSRLMPRSAPLGSLAKKERYRRLAAAARAGSLSEKYTRLIEIFPLPLIEELLGEPIDDFAPSPADLDLPPNITPLRLAMQRDQHDYLPGDILWKVDSAAMAHALEVRSPFLDHHVVALANFLDESHLLTSGRGKLALRQEFARDLPPEILTRSKKGFAVPIGDWFRSTLRAPLHDLLLSPGAAAANLLSRSALQRLVGEHEAQTRDHTHRLFALLMLELWFREFRPAIES